MALRSIRAAKTSGAIRAARGGGIIMTPFREKPPTRRQFLKRRTLEQGKALADTACLATHRLYCETLGLWRSCAKAPCKRHRQCRGNATACLLGGLRHVAPERRRQAEKEVIAGGPRRIPPATHYEWVMRRTTLAELSSWIFGKVSER
jgi:hypothetical protein